jgi:hypothetical protein
MVIVKPQGMVRMLWAARPRRVDIGIMELLLHTVDDSVDIFIDVSRLREEPGRNGTNQPLVPVTNRHAHVSDEKADHTLLICAGHCHVRCQALPEPFQSRQWLAADPGTY